MKPKEMILAMLDYIDEKDYKVELRIRDSLGVLTDIYLDVVYFHYTGVDANDDGTDDIVECLEANCQWCKARDVPTKAVVFEGC